MSTKHLTQAITTLRQGGVIAYPTEAVYGLGCDPENRVAVQRLLALKQREEHKGVILLVADWEMLEPWIQPLSKEQKTQLQQSWPGPITWLIPASPKVPRWIRGSHQTIAIRMTAHPLAHDLCHQFGKPLVSTSANTQAQPPAKTAEEVRHYFGTQLDLIIAGKLGNSAKPSQIRDLQSGQIIRS